MQGVVLCRLLHAVQYHRFVQLLFKFTLGTMSVLLAYHYNNQATYMLLLPCIACRFSNEIKQTINLSSSS